ncbi:MAG TPA: hypothetical protein VHO69_05150 [Phototrophicaceae bacterium]|nr:hypothetical protein [Phototrophicaceae bacterium]
MRVQRVSRRNNKLLWVGCGCLGALGIMAVVTIIGVIVLLPALPGLAAQVAGLQPSGSTANVFAAVEPTPDVQLQNPVSPPDAVLNVSGADVQPLPAGTNTYTVTTGTNSDGAPVALVTFTESRLMELCYQRTQACSNTNEQFRNLNLDLRPGGAVVYADVLVPQLGVTQTIGVVLRLDSSRRQFAVAGVDISGTLYTIPPDTLGTQVAQIAQTGNDLLRQLELEAGGGQYALAEVYIDDTTVTLVLR